jgi:hypothetical protein
VRILKTNFEIKRHDPDSPARAGQFTLGPIPLKLTRRPVGAGTPAPQTFLPALVVPPLPTFDEVVTQARTNVRNHIDNQFALLPRHEVRFAEPDPADVVRIDFGITPLTVGPESAADDVAEFLGTLHPDSFFWEDEQKEEAVRRLTELAVQDGVDPEVDALVWPHLPMLLGAVDADTPVETRTALVDSALRHLEAPAPDYDAALAKGFTAQALQLRRFHFADLLRPGPDDTTPPLLRQHALPLLRAYQADLQALEAGNVQPSKAAWDCVVLPLLVEGQNARTPGLQVKLFTKGQQVQYVADHAHHDHERIGILDFGKDDVMGPAHHCAIHDRTSPNLGPRVTLLDSFTNPAFGIADAVLAFPPGTRVTPVCLDTQVAQECVIYALSMAKKIHQYPGAVNALPEVDAGPPETAAGRSLRAVIQDPRVLPPAFLKHWQRGSTFAGLPPDVTQAVVNKKGQTFAQRWDANRVTRDGATYSASIEKKRLQFVEQAIEHFEGDGAGGVQGAA